MEFGRIGGIVEAETTTGGGMINSGTQLVICFAVGVFLCLALLVFCKIYFRGKSSKEKQMAIKKAQDRIDRAMEGTDDPNEMARFVP